MTATERKVFIKSYGCQMNVYDAERMSEALAACGYTPAAAADDADLVILNTCHIREKAAEKVYSELGRLRPANAARKHDGKEAMIAVAGCVAQAEGEEIIARAPIVDMVFGPQTYHRIADYVARARAGEKVVETEFPAEDKFAELGPRPPERRRTSAFVTVQEGCDKFCTFCVVPYTRGAEYSRPPEQIVAETRRLVEAGVREITLLGQNVNAYAGETAAGAVMTLAGLIDNLSRLDGLERIRYTTSHPRDMSDDLIAAHGDNVKLMPYLHLPVQSGADAVLKAMNRAHTAADYVRLVERIRHARGDIALSGDFIVGFPGESESDFQATLDLVEEVGYAQAFSFKYSPRPGTPGAEREDQVEEDIKADRLHRLQALLRRHQEAFNRAFVGRRTSVLLDKPGRHAGQLVGRTPYLQPVHVVAARERIGEIVDVAIETVGANSLSGHIVDDTAARPGPPAAGATGQTAPLQGETTF